MRRYFSFSHLNLPKTTGVDNSDGRRTSVDHAGHLSFGPYITLPKGSYYAGFDLTFDSIDGQASIDVKVEDKTIAAEALDDVIVGSLALYGVAFSIEHETRDLEVRLEVTSGVQLTLHRLVIFSM